MILLAVGYHYVAAEPPAAARAIFPVTVDGLAAQLELVGRSFEFVSRDELIAAAAGEAPLPDRACVVTFDDGLRCQHELALPVLERLGVPAIFFVAGQPLAEERALYVHKVHALRERVRDGELLRLAGADADVEAEVAQEHYRYDEPDAARLKYLLNMALPLDERERVVGAAFAEVFPDEQAFARRLYMSREDVEELERRHAAVGAHSYAHEPLARLDDEALDRDLEAVSELLEEVTGSRPRALSYPHGTSSTVDVRVARRAEAAGFRVAFTMERALNRTFEEPLLLGRLDANDAPGGKRPLDEIPPARSRYFAEAVPAA
jgi:peptidoglycan/xylan/chitin deacetylase (PgdA/CDA1 family)